MTERLKSIHADFIWFSNKIENSCLFLMSQFKCCSSVKS